MCAAILALLAQSGVATSQVVSPVINDQLQLGDVFSTQVLDVEEAEDGLDATSTAVGNIASVVGQKTTVQVESSQVLQSNVAATTSNTVEGTSGPLFSVVTSATGNSLTAGTCCNPVQAIVTQSIDTDREVTAFSYNGLRGPVQDVSVNATAVGNTAGWQAANGGIDTLTDQSHLGTTYAKAEGELTEATGTVALAATAVANDVTVEATNSWTDMGVVQSKDGYGALATVEVKIEDAQDLAGQATATGNNINVATSGKAAWLSADQTSAGVVTANTSVEVTNWAGTAQAIAYGVGNSTLVTNDGPEIALGMIQNTVAEVTGTANLTGHNGGDAYVEASAVGNALTANACGNCGGAIGAETYQTSGGPVTATAGAIIGAARSVKARATAIGNTVTYQVGQ